MLLRQFISASNAIEEIYIVKRENESDNEENPPVDKLLPENSAVPISMTVDVSNDEYLTLAVEIKSEPEDEQNDDNKELETKVVNTDEPRLAATDDLKRIVEEKSEVKSEEDDDDVPLAVRIRKAKHASAERNRNLRKVPEDKRCDNSDSDNANDDDCDDSDDEKQQRQDPNCNICDIKFHTKHELKGHLRRKHTDMLPFECDKCASGKLKSVCSLNKHFAMHDRTKPHKCYYCEARFSSRIHRTAHQRKLHKEDVENDSIRNANRRFVCRYCNKRFAAKFNLERHERNHEMKITDDESFLNRRNKCYLCAMKPFESKDALIEHLSIHVDKLPYTCRKCEQPVVITSVRLLNKHLASHEEPEKPIKCVYCSERFISVVACQAHERTHVQEKEADEVAVAKIESERISAKIIIVDGMKRYECGYCGNSYSLLSTLRRHENIHTGKVQYICKVCGKIFSKSSCLLQHERTHSRNAPYKCEICGRGFKETIRLIEHRRIHSGERPFTCEICFKSFRIKPLLKEHSLQCTAPDISMESKCRFCPKVFSCFRELSGHITSVHPTTIEETQCEFCDLRFKDAIQLAEHENYHRNPNSIKCEVCGRVFKQLSNLRRHQRLHSNDAVPFQCDLCGKSFSQAGALKVHKRIHSGEKPYKCELCEQTFYHSSTMNRHKRSHYKAKSKLFLFGETNRASNTTVLQLDAKSMVTSIATIPAIAFVQQQQQPSQNGQKQSCESGAMLSLEAASIPVSVESHSLLATQVPNAIQNQASQQISFASFGIAAAGALHESASATLEDGTPLYVLDTKLLIPQTIMQNQEDGSAGSLDLETSIEARLGQQ
ncbi:zinc finger protein 345-like [Toxorhynchites rutilus septentrionalis]|uniref:zinc finger protein 345-like n=1 Tax=Toxorhynchites rutilus septentrionalis TaxID=329112 RepID=UPI0024794B2A|nr:zinc finger protein 345-like [Toxorhynchites rutilus septentrionalis]